MAGATTGAAIKEAQDMPARTFPNVGLKGGYDQHEGGWGDDQNLNLLKLSALVQGAVISKLSSTPGSPTPPAVYIFDETHPTNPNVIAIFEGPTGEETWTYVEPEAGWLFYNQQDEIYEKFDGTIWAELTMGGGGGATAYRVGFFFTTSPVAGETLLLHVFTDAVDFADDFVGARGDAGTDPAATFVLDVRKNDSSVGSISISTAGVFTFTTTGGAVSFAAGDRLSIIGPATVGSAANVCVTLKGTLTA